MDRTIQTIGFLVTYRFDVPAALFLGGWFVKRGHPATEDVDGTMSSFQMQGKAGREASWILRDADEFFGVDVSALVDRPIALIERILQRHEAVE